MGNLAFNQVKPQVAKALLMSHGSFAYQFYWKT